MATMTHGKVVMNAVQQEMQHKEERLVGQSFLNVEQKPVQRVLE